MNEEKQKKNRSPILKGCLIIIVLFVLGTIVMGMLGSQVADTPNQNSDDVSVTTNDFEDEDMEDDEIDLAETEPPAMAIEEVELSTIIADFDANQLAAEDKYGGKLIQTTGYLNNISEDLLGNYFIVLVPTNDDFYLGTRLQCFFEDKSALTELTNGQQVIVVGTGDTMDLGIIGMKDCQLVEE